MNNKTLKASFSQASIEDFDHQSTHPGAIVGSNDDLLTEILLRLPVTSILRFKSVSKHWRLLLSHTHFTNRYDKLSKSPGLFAGHVYVPFDVENPTTPPFHSFDSYFDRSGVRIVQSCNGLLLCCINQGSSFDKPAFTYYVFNPTTKQLATIPSVPGGLKVVKSICFMGLAFHQTDCVHYKLVCILRVKPDGDLFQIQIYSSDIGKWKICTRTGPLYMDWAWLHFYEGVYWNEAIHWATSYHNYFYFKIETEQLQTLPLPVEMEAYVRKATYFGESRGHLHFIVADDYDNTRVHMNVYEMLSDHSGWFVKYQLQLDQLPNNPNAFPEMYNYLHIYDFEVIDVVRGEKEEDTFTVLIILNEKLIRYNVDDKSFKHIFSFTSVVNSFGLETHRYIESLSSF